MSLVRLELGRLLKSRRDTTPGPAMPLAAAHFERARQTLREAASRVAGAANAPFVAPSFLVEGTLLESDDEGGRASLDGLERLEREAS